MFNILKRLSQAFERAQLAVTFAELGEPETAQRLLQQTPVKQQRAAPPAPRPATGKQVTA